MYDSVTDPVKLRDTTEKDFALLEKDDHITIEDYYMDTSYLFNEDSIFFQYLKMLDTVFSSVNMELYLTETTSDLLLSYSIHEFIKLKMRYEEQAVWWIEEFYDVITLIHDLIDTYYKNEYDRISIGEITNINELFENTINDFIKFHMSYKEQAISWVETQSEFISLVHDYLNTVLYSAFKFLKLSFYLQDELLTYSLSDKMILLEKIKDELIWEETYEETFDNFLNISKISDILQAYNISRIFIQDKIVHDVVYDTDENGDEIIIQEIV